MLCVQCPVASLTLVCCALTVQALADLEGSVQDLKPDLREVYITAAKEVDVGAGKKAVVIFVPVPLLQTFHRIQSRVVRELEKKFSGKHVLVVAQRRILKKETRKTRVKQSRPRSRTLTHVHDAILEDLVYPTEIVGKRTRVKLDGSKSIRVYVLCAYPSARLWRVHNVTSHLARSQAP